MTSQAWKIWSTPSWSDPDPELNPAVTEQLMGAPADPKPLFAELRAVTDNYAIPDDVCETFEAVYRSLSRADAAASATVS